MYKVSVSQLHAGMKLGKNVVSVEGLILLRAGVELKASYIEHLQRLQIPAVYVVNPLAPDIEPPEIVSDRSRFALGSGIKTVTEQLQVNLTNQTRQQGKRWAAFDVAQVKQALDTVISEVVSNRHALVHLQDIRTADDYTMSHSISVCILSAMVGASSGLNQAELRELGLGAALHDVGKVAIPKEILNKPGSLTPAEQAEMRQHTTWGFEILRKSPGIHLRVAHVAYQHHEQWLGGGYPRGLKGTQILEFARMVTVVDVYDALVSDRQYKKGLEPRRALRLMTEGSKGFFDPTYLKVFTSHIAVYPIGSILRLNDGSVAVVTEVRKGDVERPVVRVVQDPGGRVLDRPYGVDLAAEPKLAVEQMLEEEPTAAMQQMVAASFME